MPLTVMTWLWSQVGGRTLYTAEHVNIWADMVRRWCSLDIELACITDTPAGIDPAVRIIAPPGDFVGLETRAWRNEKPNCYRRIALFRPDAADLFGERFVSMDLDCVIGASLDPLWSRREDVVLYRSPTAPYIDRPYNGSMLMMNAGSRPAVFESFSLDAAEAASRRYRGSDQAWISTVLGFGEAVWCEDDGVYWHGVAPGGDARRLLFFPGAPKPWELVRAGVDPWVIEHYRRNPRGRALYLGYGAEVWSDAEAALAEPYAGVIACQEAAAHWPMALDAVARELDEGERVARMLGFDEIVPCGAGKRKAG